jgi:hypothetical protein
MGRDPSADLHKWDAAGYGRAGADTSLLHCLSTLTTLTLQIPRLINHSLKPGTGEGVISVSKEVIEESEPPSFADGIGFGMHGNDSVDSKTEEMTGAPQDSKQSQPEPRFEPLVPSFSAALHIRPSSQETEPEEQFWHLEKGFPMQIKKALIVDKTTRYEMERDHYGTEGEDLKRELTIRGMVPVHLSLFLVFGLTFP